MSEKLAQNKDSEIGRPEQFTLVQTRIVVNNRGKLLVRLITLSIVELGCESMKCEYMLGTEEW